QLVMYKISWPDLACASAAMVSSALLPVKRSIWTSTFSFAAYSSINASQVLLAFGTKWSQKPTESLPAACAVLTNGAAIIVVDAATDVAMNRRRVKVFLFIVVAPFSSRAIRFGAQQSGHSERHQSRYSKPRRHPLFRGTGVTEYLAGNSASLRPPMPVQKLAS